MSRKEEIENYYEYNPDGGDTWWRKTPPRRNRRLEEGIAAIAGNNPFGKPILRVVWGSRHFSDISAVPTLKYKQIWQGKEFFYVENEKEIRIKHVNDAPSDKLIQSRFVQREIGRLRWIIEKWQSVEDAVRTGRFSDERDEKGKRLWKEPPAEGCYNHWWRIETADGKFRDLDDEVLQIAREMWHYQQTTPIRQQMRDIAADEKIQRELSYAATQSLWRKDAQEDIEMAYESIRKDREAEVEAERRSHTLISI